MKYSFKDYKEKAKQTLKKHYLLLVFLCLAGALLNVEQGISTAGMNLAISDSTKSVGIGDFLRVRGFADIYEYISGTRQYFRLSDDVVVSVPDMSRGITNYAKDKVQEFVGQIKDTASGLQDYMTDLSTSGKEIKDTVAGTVDDIKQTVKSNMEGEHIYRGKNLGPLELGSDDGVFAKIVNIITSGSILNRVFTACLTIGASESIALNILIILIVGVWLLAWFMVIRVFLVISRRFVLESRVYEKVPFSRTIGLIRQRSWIHVSWVLFRTTLCQLAWSLTIVGGIIKYYSYSFVPYILAENPHASFKEAIKLSMDMTRGRKWEMFVMDLSFIGWRLLGLATFGFADVFYVQPYIFATKAEYFAACREKTLEQKLSGAEILTDTYLYEKADPEYLKEAYAALADDADCDCQEGYNYVPVKEKGVSGFLAKNFGIVLKSGREEIARCEAEERKIREDAKEAVFRGQIYPFRLLLRTEPGKKQKHSYIHYIRRYSIWSLILMFFAFSFIGWAWEVSLHLVEDGVFVNRGVLTGPWLPIYGSGGLIMLLLLYRWRSKPLVELIAMLAVSGVLEYFTSFFLERRYGLKWWDYTGYYININGRICAEGLLLFALGGMAMVYILAPLFDNLFKKLKLKYIIPICVVLILIFTMDWFLSRSNPNTGAGITDYGTEEIQ